MEYSCSISGDIIYLVLGVNWRPLCSSCLSREVEEPIRAPKQIPCSGLALKVQPPKEVFSSDFRGGRQGLEGSPPSQLPRGHWSTKSWLLAL